MHRSGQGCATIIGILMLLSFMGRASGALIPLLIMGGIAYSLFRQMERSGGPPWSGTAPDRRPQPRPQPRPEPATESPVIDILVTRAAEAMPTYTQPVSGPTLDLRLSFEASDVPSVAGLVPGFVRDQVTIVDSGTRLVRAGWREYSYRLRGPESVLRELCAFIERLGYANLTAFW